MKKTYNKLTAELLLIESEGGFMAGSAWACKVSVEKYHNGFESDEPFEIGFGSTGFGE